MRFKSSPGHLAKGSDLPWWGEAPQKGWAFFLSLLVAQELDGLLGRYAAEPSVYNGFSEHTREEVLQALSSNRAGLELLASCVRN